MKWRLVNRIGIFLYFLSSGTLFSQNIYAQEAPKLVIGIVVDQMRYDYLDRFWNKFGEDGFKALVDEGWNYKNMHYNYVPTYTAPGHASIYTGTTPRYHGIVGNNWYDRKKGEKIYCVDDQNYQTVGSSNTSGQKSPKNMLSSTITDQLKIATQGKAKTIGIALKDRGAILPAGHMANAAYWFDGESGNWVSSTYYMNQLPQWVKKFNQLNLPDYYLSETWNTVLPIEEYSESLNDLNPYEQVFEGKNTPTFPYDLKALNANKMDYELIKSTPYGNKLTTDFAINTIEHEEMGMDEITDFITISYSSTDYVGHAFGPRSVELEDTYIRLDRELERLLSFLDNVIGVDEYLLFLTSDHGVAENPKYLSDLGKPTGFFKQDKITESVNYYLSDGQIAVDSLNQYTCTQAEYFINQQLYINENCGNLSSNIEKSLKYLSQLNGVLKCYPLSKEYWSMFNNDIVGQKIFRGYHEERSGNVYVNLLPGWLTHRTGGSDHGSAYNYDSHVPFIIYGKDIDNKTIEEESVITDIAEQIRIFINVPKTEFGK